MYNPLLRRISGWNIYKRLRSFVISLTNISMRVNLEKVTLAKSTRLVTLRLEKKVLWKLSTKLACKGTSFTFILMKLRPSKCAVNTKTLLISWTTTKMHIIFIWLQSSLKVQTSSTISKQLLLARECCEILWMTYSAASFILTN